MKIFDVQIKAVVIKTIRVLANDEEEAEYQAHEQFTSEHDGEEEKYEQDTYKIEEVFKGE
jgi:hypothetical protein